MRATAVPRDWRNANPISSGAPRLIGEQVSLFSAWGSVAGRRRANSASNRACRAAAHATTLSRPITASTSSASSSPAGSAVPESSSRASQPDGRHCATEYGGAPSGSAAGSSGQPVDHGSPWTTAATSRPRYRTYVRSYPIRRSSASPAGERGHGNWRCPGEQGHRPRPERRGRSRPRQGASRDRPPPRPDSSTGCRIGSGCTKPVGPTRSRNVCPWPGNGTFVLGPGMTWRSTGSPAHLRSQQRRPGVTRGREPAYDGEGHRAQRTAGPSQATAGPRTPVPRSPRAVHHRSARRRPRPRGAPRRRRPRRHRPRRP